MDYYKFKNIYAGTILISKYCNKNIYIGKNVKGYTEDDVLISTIYANNISNNMDTNDCEEFFSKFGKVKNVNILDELNDSINNGRNLQAFVTFEKPESALNAILFYRDVEKLRCSHSFVDLKTKYKNFENLSKNVFYAYMNGKAYLNDRTAKLLFGFFDQNVQFDIVGIFETNGCYEIKFDKIESAQKTFEYFHNPINVEPANSWEQLQENKPNNNNLSILKLNTDCLNQICQYLSIKDCLNLVKVSPFFKPAVPSMRNYILTENIFKELSLMYVLYLITEFASEIKYVFLNKKVMAYEVKHVLKAIVQKCTSMKILQLQTFKLNKDYQMYHYLKNLKHICMQNCEFTDNQLALLLNALNITQFELFDDVIITGFDLSRCIVSIKLWMDDFELCEDKKYFKHLVNLPTFSLYMPTSIDSPNIFQLIKEQCKRLKTLTIELPYSSVFHEYTLEMSTRCINILEVFKIPENLKELRILCYEIELQSLLQLINSLLKRVDSLMFELKSTITADSYCKLVNNPMYKLTENNSKFNWTSGQNYRSIYGVTTISLDLNYNY